MSTVLCWMQTFTETLKEIGEQQILLTTIIVGQFFKGAGLKCLARSEPPLSGIRAVPLPSDLKGGLTVHDIFSISDMISDKKINVANISHIHVLHQSD